MTTTGRMPRPGRPVARAAVRPAASAASARDPRPAYERPLETEHRPRTPVDTARAVVAQQRGRNDPTLTVADGILWRASRTPAGVATLALRFARDRVRAAAWGPGAAGALEPPQSRTIVAAARRRASIERAAASADDGDARDRVLTSLRGVGPWTAAETRIRAWGDPDAVSVGDVHLSHEVGYALVGHRVDDDGMLELLEPWRGHRQRVIRLIGLSGVHEARRAPRLHPEDHRTR